MPSTMPPVGQLGRNASRRLTDVPGTVLLLAAWAAVLVLLGRARASSKLDQIIYGTDFQGSLCGVGNLSDKPVLWYPISFNPLHGGFNLRDAIHMGLCSKSCHVSDVVPYGGYPTPVVSGIFPSGADARVILRRCIPSFDSVSGACQFNSSMTEAQRASCASASRGAYSSLLSSLGVTSVWFGIVEGLRSTYGVIVCMAFTAIVISFVWLYSMRVLVKPIAIFCAIGLLVALVVLGGLSIHAYHEQTDASSDAAHGFLAGGIMCFIAAFLYFCFLLYTWKDLMVSCNIIVEASKVVVHIPQMVAVPAVATIFIGGFGIFFAYCTMVVYTAGDFVSASQTSAASGTSVATRRFEPKEWRVPGELYTLFMFLWSMGVCHAISMMTIASCCVQWYWSMPGDDKVVPPSPVSWGLRTTLVYHFGTVAVGSLLIAIVQWCRVVLRIFEKRFMKWTGADARVAKFIVCIAQCYLACLERLVKFLTEHAYVMTAMTGDSLIPAARASMHLLVGNLKVLGVNILGDVIVTLGKLLVTALNVFFAYLWLMNRNDSESNELARHNFLILLVIIAIITYFIASVFATVFSISIDSILLCYCVDCETNDGAGRPHYFPASLRRHVEAAHSRSGSTKGSKSAGEEAPLI